MRVEAGINTTSEPTGQPPRNNGSWGREHVDYTPSEGDTRHPSGHAEQAAAQDLGLLIDRLTTGLQLALAVSIRWLLTSWFRHLEEENRTMADITFGHRTGHTPPATMDHCGQWHYVATRLMAHMGAYSPDVSVQPYKGTTSGTSVDPRDTRGTPQATSDHGPKRSRSPPGRRHAVSFHDATRGHHLRWVPPLARTEAPSDRSPREGTKAVLKPQGCRAARRSGTRRQGTLAAPGAAAARRLPQHGESSSTRIWTEAMEVPTTSTPNRHHLPPIPDAGPTGPAANRRTSRTLHASRARATGSASHGPPPGSGRNVQLVRRLPPRVGGRPAAGETAHRGHTAKGTRGGPAACTRGGGTTSPTHPSQAGPGDTGPGRGHRPPDQLGPYTTGFPTPAATQPNRRGAEDAPRQQEHDASGPRADEEMTETSGPQKTGDSLPSAVRCPSNGSLPRGTCLGEALAPRQGTPPGLAPHRTRTGRPCPPNPPDHRNGGTRTPLTTRN